MIAFRIVCVAVCFPSLLMAGASIDECKTLNGDTLRLSCYDEAAGYSKRIFEEAPEEADGAWHFAERFDDFSNENISYVSLLSDKSQLNATDAPVVLYLRCDGRGGTVVLVGSGGYVGATNQKVPIRYKFGANAPAVEYWNGDTTGRAAYLPHDSQGFRDGLLSGEDFVFEMTDTRGTRFSARFVNGNPEQEKFKFVWNGCKAAKVED